jgi:4-amino-4-deoxy-L-arabinose transferase-like glycosyltransferase
MRRAAWNILAFALAVRVLLALITAPDDKSGALLPWFNDEPSHLNYVRYLDQHNRLPVQTASVQDGFQSAQFEYYQPPLYYYLARPFYALGQALTLGRELYWVRLVSVLFSLVGLSVIYPAVLRVLGARAALLALLLAAFSGVPLRHGYLAGNDSLFFALICMQFALSLAALSGGADRRLTIAAILIAAAGLWTKASFLLVLPVYPLALLLAPVLPGQKPSPRLWPVLAASLIPLAAITPWYLWNYRHYAQFLPMSVGFGPLQPWTFGNFGERLFLTANYFTRTLVFPYEGLWGGLWDKIIYPLEGLAFLVLATVGFLRLRRVHPEMFRLSLAAVGLTLAGYVWLNLHYAQAEARYLLSALPFLFCLMALAALQVQGKHRRLSYVIIGVWIVLPWVGVGF